MSDYDARVRDGFYGAFKVMSFEMEVLLSIRGFVVNICENLAILII